VDGIDVYFSLVLDLEAAAETGGGDIMIPRPAQYLLRFDDLCPTQDGAKWRRFAPLLREFGIKPILAVVPDNRDTGLELSPPDDAFWDETRAMEAAGATIGLHGYRHVCETRGRSLVPLHRETEFAGVPEATQREWIHAGLDILRGHGLNPKIWVAPRHGFDRATLRALRGEGIGLLSDGFARRPFTRDGVIWLPQQLWAPQTKSSGLWTICLHSNAAPDSLVDQLRSFLVRYGNQFTSVDRVVAELQPGALDLSERMFGASSLLRIQIRRAAKLLSPRD
jgi:hypothetical protein